MASYPCLQDVLPVLTSLNVLFQSAPPLPHLLYRYIVAAKRTLIKMVGTRCDERERLMPLDSVKHDTPFGAYANKFVSECCGATGRDPDIWHAAFTGRGPATEETVAQTLFPLYV
jgi:hypothetical protein